MQNPQMQLFSSSFQSTFWTLCNICEFRKQLKFTEKVSINIASESSYIYILIGHKFIRNSKNVEAL